MENVRIKPSCCYRWYALYTRSRMEKKARLWLEQRGIECYLPLKRVRRQWGKQSRTTYQPLISCYIFVRVSQKERYDVLMADGVSWYISFDGKPAVIPDCQMESLKLFVEKQDSNVEVTSERISKGDLIKVIDGPLKDACAEVVEIRGKHRLLIRFNALGCCIHVELGTNTIELVSGNDKPREKISYC